MVVEYYWFISGIDINEIFIVCFLRGEPESIETLVFPSTGEDSQSQYVCVRLIVELLPGYPDTTPIVNLRNPRGLDEETVKQIQSDADAKCIDIVGQPMMFELIEVTNLIFYLDTLIELIRFIQSFQRFFSLSENI